jgi:FKBP-type peptidyl-prolyl cis-trans isomerase
MIWLKIVATGLLLCLAGCQPSEQNEDTQDSAPEADADTELVGEAAEASYSMGFMVASQIEDGFAGTLDEKAFLDGISDQFNGQEEGNFDAHTQKAMAYVQRIQYEVIVAGDGAMPTLSDTVTTHYHGTFIDGEVFDSSVDSGEPTSFPVGGVISGWTEALQLMPLGSKWRLVVPAGLAYGSQDRGSIPPNSTLVFEVELLEIN